MGARLHGAQDLGEVRAARRVIDQEVEHGAVVPKVYALLREQLGGHIADNPVHTFRTGPQPRPHLSQRGVCEVYDGQVAVPQPNQVIDEG